MILFTASSATDGLVRVTEFNADLTSKAGSLMKCLANMAASKHAKLSDHLRMEAAR